MMNSKYMDYFFKIMSMLVIPLVLWGVKLEVGSAVQDEKIVQLEIQVTKNAGIEAGVAANTNALGRMEEKLNAANENLKDIKGLVRDLAKHP